MHSSPSLPETHAEEQKDHREAAANLKQAWEQLAGVERDEEQARKVFGHLDFHCEQAQAQQVIAPPDPSDDHLP